MLAASEPAAFYPSSEQSDDAPWFALRVRSNFEHQCQSALSSRGMETFLPSVKLRRRWSDRVKVIDQPLFPGYVFCRFALSDRGSVLRTPGVVQVVGAGASPVPVAESELRYIRTVVVEELAARPHPYLAIGQAVRLHRGPLAGAEGILTAVNGRDSLVLSIGLLQRSVAVEVEADWVHRA